MLGRSLLMKASGARLLYPNYVQDYLDRVTAADVAAGNTLGLELGVTDAFNTCLQDMVADTSLGVSGGVLAQAASLIKASCAMQGARTLPGALVPLASDMPAPTNVNFVAGDYNRRTGLGDPANVSKHLNSNRSNNADPQNNNHNAVFATAVSTSNSALMSATGATGADAGTNLIAYIPASGISARNRSGASFTATGLGSGLKGVSRSTGTAFLIRNLGTTTTATVSSDGNSIANTVELYRRNIGQGSILDLYSNARLNFYSIGLALDLAILDARITALSNAIQAAIP